jgi:hypothetical protein
MRVAGHDSLLTPPGVAVNLRPAGVTTTRKGGSESAPEGEKNEEENNANAHEGSDCVTLTPPWCDFTQD